MRSELKGKNIAEFVNAGHAIFTLLNENTGNRFTYRLRSVKFDNGDEAVFAYLLNGPNNDSNYAYMGVVRKDKLIQTKGSKVTNKAQGFKVLDWFLKRQNDLPEVVHVYHEGRCGRCGRTLTVPESIERGIGPECAKKLS